MSVEENERYWEKTRELLQNENDPMIRKPKLTEKLLKRPPFRFIHDVISAIQDKTGFAKDLFDMDQRDAKAIDNKEAKLAYLEKIINYLNTENNISSDVNPLKIIAGLEPEKTNLLLQEIGKEALKYQNSNLIIKKESKPNRPVSRPSSEQKKFIDESLNHNSYDDKEVVKSTDNNGINILNLMEEVKNYNDKEITNLITKNNIKEEINEDQNVIEKLIEEDVPMRSMPVIRPMTARKAPPRLKQMREQCNILINSQRPSTTGFSQMRPSTCSNGGGRPSTTSIGRPSTCSNNSLSLKKTEMIKTELISSDSDTNSNLGEDEIVDDILKLDNIKKEKDELNMMINIDKVDVETIVQGVCRNVTPLITYVESLQENINEMKKEHKMLKMECKKYEEMIAEPREKDIEVIELENKIKDVDGEIIERNDKISRLNVIILENEKKIKRYINSIVTISK